MIEYRERLAAAMKRANLDTTALRKAMGVSYQAVKRVLDGKTGAFSAENNSKAAQVLGVDSDWLASGEGLAVVPTRKPSEPSNVEAGPNTLRPVQLVPVVGEVKGGDDGYFEELQYPVGHGEGTVPYWVRDPHAYALRVKGDSMSPRFRAGEFVVITPSIEAQPGNDVVVLLHNGKKLLKQLGWDRVDAIQLTSINNGYAPMTIERSEISKIHRVAGSVPHDAFLPS